MTDQRALLLAREFDDLLRHEIGEDDFAEVLRLNRTAEYRSGSCASHNYCDANMTMIAAYQRHRERSLNCNDAREVEVCDEVLDEIGAAWEIWRRTAHCGECQKLINPSKPFDDDLDDSLRTWLLCFGCEGDRRFGAPYREAGSLEDLLFRQEHGDE